MPTHEWRRSGNQSDPGGIGGDREALDRTMEGSQADMQSSFYSPTTDEISGGGGRSGALEGPSNWRGAGMQRPSLVLRMADMDRNKGTKLINSDLL